MAKRINPKYNVALMASAGTGKTYTLALRAVATLMRDKTVYQPLFDIKGESVGAFIGTAFGKILCITFTRKATAEMATRVNEYLAKLANGQLDETSSEYKAIADVLKISSSDEMRKRAKAVLELLYRDPSVLQVRTIDSFVNMILHLFPFESDVSPDFDILDPDSTQAVKYEAFETAFQLYFNNDAYHSLFNRYIAWADLVPKTFLNNLRDNIINFVLERAVTIERQLQDARRIDLHSMNLVLDDAERNSVRMLDCLKQLLNIIKEQGKEQGIYSHFLKKIPMFEAVVNGEFPIEDCIRDIDFFDPERTRKPLNGKAPMPELYLRVYRDFEASLRNHIDYIDRLDMMILLHVAVKVQDVIDDMKADNGVLSFSDVTYAAYHMMRQPDGQADGLMNYGVSNDYLYFRLDGRLEHILIDEFQDTSDVQWKLVQPLVDEAMAGAGQGGKLGSFFCVGDPKQTIYRFRGSNPNFFHNVIEEYKGRLTEEKLDKNYRSDKAVIGFVNKLFENVDTILDGGEDITFEFSEQKADSKQEGYVSLKIASGKTAKDVSRARLKCLEEQLAEIIDVAGWRPSDIAILVAKRETGFQVQQHLDSIGIRSHVTFSEKLSDSNAYKVIRALVRYMYHRDYFSLAEFMLTMPAILPQLTRTEAINIETMKQMLDDALTASEGRPVYERLMALEGELSLTGRFSDDSNYYLLMDRIGSMLAFIINPLEFGIQIDSLAMNTTAASIKGGAGIAIMTVHGAKGLEFPVVIIHDIRKNFQIHPSTRYFINEHSFMDAQIYKKHRHEYRQYSSESYKKGEELEEKLTKYGIINELYVATTRARNMLYYTMGVSSTKSENTDSYVQNVFKEEYTAGVLRCAEDVGMVTASKKAYKMPYSDLYTDLIGFPVKKLLAGGDTNDIFADNQNKYPASILKRAVAYVEQIAESRPTEVELSYEPYLNRYYGTFVHEIVYQLVRFSSDGLDAAVDKAWNRYGGYLDSGMKESARQAVLLLVQDERWQKIVSGADFYREKTVSNKGKPLVVDLYAVKEEEIIVVDFKTGDRFGARHEEYVAQVQGYMYVLSRQYKRPVMGYLIYLNEHNVWIEKL